MIAFRWVTRSAGGGLTKDHKEHKEEKRKCSPIKLKTLKFASEKLTRAPQAELVHHVSWVTRSA